MKLQALVKHALLHPTDAGAWGVLVDAVEETGRPVWTWVDVLDQIGTAVVSAIVGGKLSADGWELIIRAWRALDGRENLDPHMMLFYGLAKVSYRYAVDLHLNPEWMGQVRHHQHYEVDGMNSAHCKPTWEQDLRRERVEEVLREQGNLERQPLRYRGLSAERPERYSWEANDPELASVDAEDGRRFWPISELHHHVLWMEFAPEWWEDPDGDQFDRVRAPAYLTLVTDGGGYQSNTADFIYIPDSAEVWERVDSPSHGAETECPVAHWDPEEREDARDRLVTFEDTVCGERPGEACRYCDADLGDQHGYLYIGEGAQHIYRRIEAPEADE